MDEKKFMAWTAFTLFVLAAAVMVLVIFFPSIERYDVVSPEGAL